MDTLANLRTFVAVAKYGGFSDAAKQLDVVPSVVAKRISQLEGEMGTRLFQRSTRRVQITAGPAFGLSRGAPAFQGRMAASYAF